MEDMDLRIEQLKANMIKLINESGLSISVVYHVLNPIMDEVAMSYRQYAQQIMAQAAAPEAPKIDAEEINE